MNIEQAKQLLAKVSSGAPLTQAEKDNILKAIQLVANSPLKPKE